MKTFWFIPLAILLYFLILIVISYFTGRKSDNSSFFLGERKSPWYVVAYGMIGASLSGVTFISVPGWVGKTNFTYFQMVLGYIVGYYVIAYVLMPVYYRMNVISIYTYLERRFGIYSYKTGSAFFLLSRLIGASFRLYLVAIVFELIFQKLGYQIPFAVSVIVTVALIWIYTNRGGIKTIIWTDTLQTTFMLLAVVFTIISVSGHMGWSFGDLLNNLQESGYSKWFISDNINRADHFIKYFISGAFIAIAMTGLDQDMMQKNLSCRNIGEAQKNMVVFSWILVFVNLLFLGMGALLFLYSEAEGLAIPERSDYLFPQIALSGDLGDVVLITFVLGLIASAYSSADSALTALTTSFSIDMLDIEKKYEKAKQEKVRRIVHIGMSVVIVVIILIFRILNNESVINNLMKAAGYTYGPLLGLFAYGLLSKWRVKDRFVPIVAVASPVLTYFFQVSMQTLFPGFEIGFEVILLNALFTFVGLRMLTVNQFKIG